MATARVTVDEATPRSSPRARRQLPSLTGTYSAQCPTCKGQKQFVSVLTQWPTRLARVGFLELEFLRCCTSPNGKLSDRRKTHE
jgi:hypothetical protein